jgi:hypothetical protein
MRVLWLGFLLIFPLISLSCTQKGQDVPVDSATFDSSDSSGNTGLNEGLEDDALGTQSGSDAQINGVSVEPVSPSGPSLNPQAVSPVNIHAVNVAPTLSENCQGAALVEGSNEFRGKIIANDFTTCRVNFGVERNRVCVVSGSSENFGVVTTWEPVDYMEIKKIGNEPIIATLIQYICLPMDAQVSDEPEES